jgi:hypothetical protein
MKDEELENYFLNPRNKSLVNGNLFELYRRSILTHDFSNDYGTSFLDRILVHSLTLLSVYQCHLFISGNEKFQFGVELEKKEKYLEYLNNHKKLNPSIDFTGEFEIRNIKEIIIRDTAFSIYCISKNKEIDFLFIALVPSSIIDFSNSIHKIILITYNYFSGKKNIPISNYHPVFSKFKENLKNKIISYPYLGRVRGVLAHFQIEDLNSYCKIMGEEFSKNILTEISNTIQKKLKKSDIFYTLSPRSYLAYLPDCDVKPVIQRFEDLFLKINPITIQYKLDFYEIKPSNIEDLNYMDKLLGNEINVVESIGIT